MYTHFSVCCSFRCLPVGKTWFLTGVLKTGHVPLTTANWPGTGNGRQTITVPLIILMFVAPRFVVYPKILRDTSYPPRAMPMPGSFFGTGQGISVQ